MKILRVVALVATGALTLLACGDDASDAGRDASAPTSPPAATDGAGSVPATDATTAGTSPATTLPSTTTAPDPATVLPGRTYVSTAVEGFTLVEGTVITLTFDGSNIGANAGCNQLGSSWTVEDGVLVVAQMAQTMMACDPPAKMDQDTWLSALLTSRPTLTLAGDTLTLAAPGATVTFQDQMASAAGVPLEGTTWTAESILTGDVASSLPAGTERPPTMTFESGAVTLDTGCNNGSGSYTVAGDAITFGPIATTRMACLDPGAADTEQHVLTVLTGTATFSIDGGSLTLTNGDLGLVARSSS